MITIKSIIEALKDDIKNEAKRFDIGFTRFTRPYIIHNKDSDIFEIDLDVSIYRKFVLSGIELRHNQDDVKNHIHMMLSLFDRSVREKIYEVLIGDVKPKEYGYGLVIDNSIPKGIIFCHPLTATNIRSINMNPHIAGKLTGAIAEGIKIKEFKDISVEFRTDDEQNKESGLE